MTEDNATRGTSRRGEFHVLSVSFWGNGLFSGLEIVNEGKLLLPGRNTMEPPNGDPGQYRERPHLVHFPDVGGMPRDIENLFGKWVVSEALKHVLETVDPAGFVFSACGFTLADGSTGPQYHLCKAVRWIDALDDDASRVKIGYERDYQTGEDVKLYSVSGGASLVFRKHAIGPAHVFRQPGLGVDAICDRVMADALDAARLDGISLRDAYDF